MLRDKFPNVPIICTTASANEETVSSLSRMVKLKQDKVFKRLPVNRENLS